MKRIRKCQSCQKPLGATVVRCHDCGGETPDRHGDSLRSARMWKQLLGVKPKLIDESHDESEHSET